MLVAVYGTLREGCGNWRWCLKDRAEKISTERLSYHKMYSMGGFPFIVESDDEHDEITCEVFDVNPKISDAVLSDLDSLEGYPYMYNRKVVDTSHGDAHIYYMGEKDENFYPFVESGDWLEFIEDKK